MQPSAIIERDANAVSPSMSLEWPATAHLSD